MKSRLFAAILLASGLGGACFAQGAPAASPSNATPTPAAATATTPVKHKNDPDAIICKRIEELGSRLGGGKVCQTRAEWDQQSRDSEDDLNDTTQRSREMAPPGA
jgi:hypothetical protein